MFYLFNIKRAFFVVSLAAFVFAGLFDSANAAPTAGELDSSLNLTIDTTPGNVQEIVAQTDGKLLVVGNFRTVNSVRRKSIVRLNADFSLDTTFNADVNGTIVSVAVQADGKVLIGGAFDVVGGQSRKNIARLNADGSLDTTFNVGTGAENVVYDIAVQADGKIIISGNFYGVNNRTSYGVARLNTDGTVDTTFTSPIPLPIPSSTPPFPIPSLVYSVIPLSDGKLIIAGLIVTSYSTPQATTTTIARLNADGSYDSSFNTSGISGNLTKAVRQPDGKILIAGFFTISGSQVRQHFARLNADGSLDTAFNNQGTGANFPVNSIFLKSDGKILIVGRFSTVNGVNRSSLAQINADGSLDETFVPSGGSLLGSALTVIFANNKVLVGGVFNAVLNGSAANSVKVFNADGTADTAFLFGTTTLGSVRAIAVQADGKIIVGGNFTRPRSSSALSQIFRINTDGTVDTTFGNTSSGFSSSGGGQLNSIIIQPDGKILIAGVNLVVNNGSTSFIGGNIFRLTADGLYDSSFNAGEIPTARGLNQIALQPDGKVVVVWGYNLSGGFPAGGAARLNADGSLDSTFTSGLPAAFYDSVSIQADGKIIVGGPFNFAFINSQTGSVAYNGVVRLNADGSRDTNFVPATFSDVNNNRFTQIHAVVAQADGKILIGGRIFAANSTATFGVARLNADGSFDSSFNSSQISGIADSTRVQDILQLPNGKILVGGLFDGIAASVRKNVARLNADGSADNSFVADTDSTVYEVVTQTDGKILIGGDFEFVNNTPRTSLARLLSEPVTRRTQFDFDGDGKADVSTFRPSNGAWYLLNSQTGFSAIQFGTASDKIVPADYDGDGRTDVAVYRNGVWYLQRSSAGFTGVSFGAADDVPQPADFDGDGKAELAVFRPSNGGWYVYNLATNQTTSAQFGQSGDKPVVGDYDADGKADLAVFRNGTWYLQRSTLGFTGVQFGDATDKAVPADYDADGKTDIAVFRPSNGTWYLNRSAQGFTAVAFGLATDLPVAADYDGDGKADVAVFRDGNWYLQRSTAGFTGVSFGAATDKPIPNAFVQ